MVGTLGMLSFSLLEIQITLTFECKQNRDLQMFVPRYRNVTFHRRNFSVFEKCWWESKMAKSLWKEFGTFLQN